MIVMYHSGDLDGHCSGAIARHFLLEPLIMVGVDYNDPLPDLPYREHDLWMLDFSYPLATMYHLLNQAKSFTWIDHHAPIINEIRANGLVNHLHGLQESGWAACELTWEYVMRNYYGDSRMPEAVRLLGRYDVFDHVDPDVLLFQYGMRAQVTDPSLPETADLWESLLAENSPPNLRHLMRNGRAILRYLKLDDAKFAKRFATQAGFDGVRCVLLNHPPGGSRVFESLDFPGCPLLVSYGKLPDGRWLVHLYSFDPTIDCGVMAKKHGGGGHCGAAGFIATTEEMNGFFAV